MSGKNWIILIGIGLTLTMAACARKTPTPTIIPLVDKDSEIANPASVYCEQYGGTLEIRTDGTGAQTGFCIFADGSECEEWAYFRGECAPASALQDTLTPAPPSSETSTPELSADGWIIFRDTATGLVFDSPPDTRLERSSGNPSSLTITGVDGWPSFTINLPTGRENWNVPPGTDLAQWLVDNNIFADPRAADVQIAGEQAVHTRFERSPQAFADDRYFFAHNGQLYMIIIGHQDDKEDWELYNRFLGSFRFEK
jgi:putative hemolysin